MTKPELIDELLLAIKRKANRMTVKQLRQLKDKHTWINTKKRKPTRKE